MADGARMPVDSFCRNVDLDTVEEAFVSAGFDVTAVERTARKVAVGLAIQHRIPRYGKVTCFACVLFDDEDLVFRYSGASSRDYYHLTRYCTDEKNAYGEAARLVWESLRDDQPGMKSVAA